ncbi:PEPxxWA-CTERM sorting domain-containing protein [Sphingomonas sp. RS6]
MKQIVVIAGLIAAAVASAPASAQSLNFAGLDGDNQELVLDYYAGGAGSLGSTGGPNYGITFSDNAIACSVQPGGSCNSAALPTGGNLLFFLGGDAATMNVAGGFSTGFSFFYSAVNNPAFVNVYSGLNGTGDLLATINLALTPNGAGTEGCFGTNFCPYVAAGVSFAGIAHSVDFGGSADQVAFAAITINSSTPGGVPEPAAWGMLIGGFGMAGAAMRARRTRVAFATA